MNATVSTPLDTPFFVEVVSKIPVSQDVEAFAELGYSNVDLIFAPAEDLADHTNLFGEDYDRNELEDYFG